MRLLGRLSEDYSIVQDHYTALKDATATHATPWGTIKYTVDIPWDTDLKYNIPEKETRNEIL